MPTYHSVSFGHISSREYRTCSPKNLKTMPELDECLTAYLMADYVRILSDNMSIEWLRYAKAIDCLGRSRSSDGRKFYGNSHNQLCHQSHDSLVV